MSPLGLRTVPTAWGALHCVPIFPIPPNPGRDRKPTLSHFLGGAELTKGSLLNGQHHDRVFDLLCAFEDQRRCHRPVMAITRCRVASSSALPAYRFQVRPAMLACLGAVSTTRLAPT